MKDYIHRKSLDMLQGMLLGICIGGVNTKEIEFLEKWLEENKAVFSIRPYDVIYTHIADILEDKKVDAEEVEDLCWLANKMIEWSEADHLLLEAIRSLHGIFQGILSDKTLTDAEILSLNNWIADNEFLKGCYPYDEIETLVTKSLADNHISEEERISISAFMAQFVEITDLPNITKNTWMELKAKYSIGALCITNPSIEFQGNHFCFTGESEQAKRNEIAQIIEDHGGIFTPNVIKKTQYLVVGAKGNECWAFAKYGRKIEKALELRKEGYPIQIIHERDFWDALQS